MEQNQQENPQANLSEHDQAMIDKVEQHETEVTESMQTDQERMLAGKYKTVEELEKAYEHLQTKLGQPAEETATETEAEAPQEEDTNKADAEEVTAQAGIDYTALESEYQETGQLSPDTYKQLEDAGIPQNMVDAYIAGQEALAGQTLNKMYSLAGGESEYNEMVTWAQDNLTESEIQAFNASLANEAQSEFAIKGLYAQYQSGKSPTLVKGEVSNTSTRGFASKQEMMAEMSNPKYKKDPAFRAEVQRRVALSKF